MNREVQPLLQDMLISAFPGLKIAPEMTIGGVLFSVQIWEFFLSVRATTVKIARGEVEGQIQLSLRRKMGSRTEILRTVTTEDPKEAQAFLDDSVALLQGVVAVIEQAFMPRSADIFSVD